MTQLEQMCERWEDIRWDIKGLEWEKYTLERKRIRTEEIDKKIIELDKEIAHWEDQLRILGRMIEENNE